MLASMKAGWEKSCQEKLYNHNYWYHREEVTSNPRMWTWFSISPVLLGFQPPNFTQLLLQPSSTRMLLKPRPPINMLAIVTTLSWQPLAQTGINASPPEMGAVQGKRTVFSSCLCIGGQQWPTQSQPRCFQSKAQRRPCCLHPSGAPTHLLLSL